MSQLTPLLTLLRLDRLPRTGWIQHGVPEPESIAGHVLGMAHLALALAPGVEPPLALERVLAMILVHDAPEALTGDLPKPASELLPEGAKATMEERAAKLVLEPLSATAQEAWTEYRSNETREARFAKLCDKLQLGVQLVAYERAGARGLSDYHRGLQDLDVSEFPAVQALLAEILEAIG